MELAQTLCHGGDVYTERQMKYADRLVDFSANLNPLGMPQAVKAAIVENIAQYECYPDPLCRELRGAIAQAEQVDPAHVLCGNGAADLIFRLAVGLKPKRAVLLAPTFAEYEQALRTVDCSIRYYDLAQEDGFALDEGLLDCLSDEIDILFLCNPNNPTGVPTKRALMEKIAKKCRACEIVLVVDECFMDFLQEEARYSIADSIGEYENLVILKAFTKMYAMAGIRLGYLLTRNSALLTAVATAGQPWSVSTVAAKCGAAALSCKEHVAQTKLLITQNRKWLMAELQALGLTVYDGKANYLFFFTADTALDKKLVEYGVLIRSCKNYRGLSDHFFRVAVRSQEENEYLIECMKKVSLEQA